MRFGIVGAAITILSLSLLHLSGVHGAKTRNKAMSEHGVCFLWYYATPQGYPTIVKKCDLNEKAKAIYDQWSETLVKEGDAPLPPRKPIRSLGDLVFSAILFFLGGPLLFFFLLVTTQKNFIAANLTRHESSSAEG